MRGGAFGTARSLGEDPLVLLGGEGGVNSLLLVLDLDGPRPLVRMLALLHRHGSQGKVVLNGIYVQCRNKFTWLLSLYSGI